MRGSGCVYLVLLAPVRSSCCADEQARDTRDRSRSASAQRTDRTPATAARHADRDPIYSTTESHRRTLSSAPRGETQTSSRELSQRADGGFLRREPDVPIRKAPLAPRVEGVLLNDRADARGRSAHATAARARERSTSPQDALRGGRDRAVGARGQHLRDLNPDLDRDHDRHDRMHDSRPSGFLRAGQALREPDHHGSVSRAPAVDHARNGRYLSPRGEAAAPVRMSSAAMQERNLYAQGPPSPPRGHPRSRPATATQADYNHPPPTREEARGHFAAAPARQTTPHVVEARGIHDERALHPGRLQSLDARRLEPATERYPAEPQRYGRSIERDSYDQPLPRAHPQASAAAYLRAPSSEAVAGYPDRLQAAYPERQPARSERLPAPPLRAPSGAPDYVAPEHLPAPPGYQDRHLEPVMQYEQPAPAPPALQHQHALASEIERAVRAALSQHTAAAVAPPPAPMRQPLPQHPPDLDQLVSSIVSDVTGGGAMPAAAVAQVPPAGAYGSRGGSMHPEPQHEQPLHRDRYYADGRGSTGSIGVREISPPAAPKRGRHVSADPLEQFGQREQRRVAPRLAALEHHGDYVRARQRASPAHDGTEQHGSSAAYARRGTVLDDGARRDSARRQHHVLDVHQGQRSERHEHRELRERVRGDERDQVPGRRDLMPRRRGSVTPDGLPVLEQRHKSHEREVARKQDRTGVRARAHERGGRDDADVAPPVRRGEDSTAEGALPARRGDHGGVARSGYEDTRYDRRASHARGASVIHVSSTPQLKLRSGGSRVADRRRAANPRPAARQNEDAFAVEYCAFAVGDGFEGRAGPQTEPFNSGAFAQVRRLFGNLMRRLRTRHLCICSEVSNMLLEAKRSS